MGGYTLYINIYIIYRLPTGDHVTIPLNISLIVELSSLDNISPNTLSNYGVVHIGNVDYSWNMLWKKWLNKNKDEKHQNYYEIIETLMNEYIQVY